MTEVRWTATAAAGLTAICDYIAYDNPDAALDVARKMHRGIAMLEDFPSRARTGRVEGTRELVFSGLPYVVVYEVGRGAVVVLRILHGSMRWP